MRCWWYEGGVLCCRRTGSQAPQWAPAEWMEVHVDRAHSLVGFSGHEGVRISGSTRGGCIGSANAKPWQGEHQLRQPHQAVLLAVRKRVNRKLSRRAWKPHQAVLLADHGVARQGVRVLVDGQLCSTRVVNIAVSTGHPWLRAAANWPLCCSTRAMEQCQQDCDTSQPCAHRWGSRCRS